MIQLIPVDSFFFLNLYSLIARRSGGCSPALAIDDGYSTNPFGSTPHAMPNMILNTKNSP